MKNDCPECDYLFQERAAIHEFEGRASREDSERMAATECCPEHRDQPASRLRITIHNLDNGKPAGVCEYIGRGRNGRLGNPFVIGIDGSRADVILKYRTWLWGHVKLRDQVFDKLRELARQADSEAGLKLLCHCKPLPCHGDVVAECLRWMEKEGLL